ncbi:MAG: hypothetical protein Q8K85_10770, partial [Hyphomicrobium sp.]|nr:hypothetical protein [Hyphomicrobium sp.]
AVQPTVVTPQPKAAPTPAPSAPDSLAVLPPPPVEKAAVPAAAPPVQLAPSAPPAAVRPPADPDAVEPWFLEHFHKAPVSHDTALFNQLRGIKAAVLDAVSLSAG